MTCFRQPVKLYVNVTKLEGEHGCDLAPRGPGADVGNRFLSVPVPPLFESQLETYRANLW